MVHLSFGAEGGVGLRVVHKPTSKHTPSQIRCT